MEKLVEDPRPNRDRSVLITRPTLTVGENFQEVKSSASEITSATPNPRGQRGLQFGLMAFHLSYAYQCVLRKLERTEYIALYPIFIIKHEH